MLFLERSLHLLPSLTEHIILSLNIITDYNKLFYTVFDNLRKWLAKKVNTRKVLTDFAECD